MTSHFMERLSRKLHGQYYTDQAIGALLVNQLKHQHVDTAIEFGVGPGALLDAVRFRWPDAKCISVDIDPKHVIKGQDSARSHYCEDALKPDISSRIGLEPESVDLAVCNPPFVTSAWKPEFKDILARAGLLPRQATLGFGADVLFLAQNLWMLRSKGQLGIIVPSGIISGERSRHVRDWLLARHTISDVVELPAGTFTATEVKTFVLCLTKDTASSAEISLRNITPDGRITAPIRISQAEASLRLDYSFYASRADAAGANFASSLISLHVTRGNIGANELRTSGIEHLHTTDISASVFPHLQLATTSRSAHDKHTTAKQGDVVLARVGRDFHKKIALITRGELVISDCLFALRSEQYAPADVYQALISEAGQRWLQAFSRGACARFITKADMERFPLKEMLEL